MKEQMKKIMSILNERLSEYGFEKKRYDTFVRVIDGNIIQKIGISSATYGKKHVRYLSPFIGIVYRDVRTLNLKLRNLEPTKYPEYAGVMIGLPVGLLMPEYDYVEWYFTRDDDVTEEANKMADAIIKYGFPYHEELSNRDGLIYGLEIGKHRGEREFTLPIFHYLNGNYKRALECTDEFIKKFSAYRSQEESEILKILGVEDRDVPVVNNGLKSYLKFVENLKNLIKQTEDSQ